MPNATKFFAPTLIFTTLLAALSSGMGFFSFSKITDPKLEKTRNLLLIAAIMAAVAVALLSYTIGVVIIKPKGNTSTGMAAIGAVLAILLLLGSTIIYSIAAAQLRNSKTPLTGAIVGSISSFISMVASATIIVLNMFPSN